MTYGELSRILIAAEKVQELIGGPESMCDQIIAVMQRTDLGLAFMIALKAIIDNARGIRVSEVPVVPLQR